MTGYDKDNDKFYCQCEEEMKLIFPSSNGINVYHCPDCGAVAIYRGITDDVTWHLRRE